MLGEVGGDPACPPDVLRVAGVVRLDLALDAGVRGAVDVVRGGVQRGQSPGDKYGAQPVGRGGQIVRGAESAEALAQHGPGRATGEAVFDDLAVAHDAVGPEAGEVLGLGLGAAALRQRLPVLRTGAAGAALVEEEDAVLLHRAAEPGLPPDEAAGAEAGTALQIHQPRQLVPDARPGDDLAAEQFELLATRVAMVERDGEMPVGEDDSRLAVCAHWCSCSVRPTPAHGITWAGASRWERRSAGREVVRGPDPVTDPHTGGLQGPVPVQGPLLLQVPSLKTAPERLSSE